MSRSGHFAVRFSSDISSLVLGSLDRRFEDPLSI